MNVAAPAADASGAVMKSRQEALLASGEVKLRSRSRRPLPWPITCYRNLRSCETNLYSSSVASEQKYLLLTR
jgi:hypothetical protein